MLPLLLLQRPCLLLCLLLFVHLLGLVCCKPPQTVTTPIRHWEPSWVASSARGTALVVACQWEDGEDADDPSPSGKSDNCVLLLTRSAAPTTVTSSLQWKPSPSSPSFSDWQELKCKPNNNNHEASENISIRILETPMDTFLAVSPSQSRSSWAPLGTGAICAMTGLASDVDHVTRVVQNTIHKHRSVFDPVSFPTPAVSTLVKSLSETVQRAATFNGGRPYGLQALLVGTQGFVSTKTTTATSQNGNRRQIYVYTVDPSGAWRHWGSGCTAIGRNAEEVRQYLYESLLEREKSQQSSLNPQSALQLAMKALLQATQAAFVNQDSDQYEAILFWVDPVSGRCRVAKIDPQNVQDCRNNLWASLQEAK